VEAKNGALIRKHIGYGYIEAQHADAITQFYCLHVNPYVNFHRTCAVPEQRSLGNGKRLPPLGPALGTPASRAGV